eukprot:scpid32544/ scgid17607/ 
MKLVGAFAALSSVFFLLWLVCSLLLPAEIPHNVADSWQLSSVAQLPMLRKLHGESDAEMTLDKSRETIHHSQIAVDAAAAAAAAVAALAQASLCGDEHGQAIADSRRFVHAQYFTEHIGFAGDALRTLSGLSTAMHRALILPQVRNAQLAGHRIGLSTGHGEKGSCLQRVINTDTLLEGPSVSAGNQDSVCASQLAATSCADGWDALIVFQHSALAKYEESDPLAMASFAKANAINDLAIASAAVSNTSAGWWDCTEEFEDFISSEEDILMRCSQLNKTVVYCVDGSQQEGLRLLEQDALRTSRCVNVLSWSAITLPYTGHVMDLNRGVNALQTRARLSIARTLAHKAFMFKSSNLGMVYVGVHMQLVSMALNGTRAEKAMRPLVDRVVKQIKQLLESARSAELLLVTDIPRWLVVPQLSETQRRAVQVAKWHHRRIVRSLRPSALEQLAELSQRHLLEYDLLASADYLVTVGKSPSQQWIVEEFDQRHPKNAFPMQLRWDFNT